MDNIFLKQEKEGNESFLIYELTSEDSLDKLSFGMMSNNDIDGLLDMVYSQIDDSKKLKYKITNKVSLKELLQDRLNKKKIVGILHGFSNALNSVDEYMIKTDKLVFDEEKIYINPETGVTEFICLPLEKVDNDVDINAFLKNILFSLQYDESENNDYISRFVNFVNANEDFDLEEFNNILESVDKDKAYTPPRKAKKKEIEKPSVDKTAFDGMEIPGAREEGISYTDNDIPEPREEAPAPKAKPKASAGFAVPGAAEPEYGEDDYEELYDDLPEEKMSLMYLLQHYNKENAAIYKKQKELKKNKSSKKSKAKPKKDKSKAKIKGSQRNINVPGMESVPGATEEKQTSDQMPENMGRVPGQEPVLKKSQGQSKVLFEPGKLQQEKGDFGETVILDREEFDDEATVLLEENKAVEKKVAYLIRTVNGEKAELNKPIVRMGKESKFVDYQIKDNPAVSRLHAELITKDEGYFIKDSNSTNNTFVNGKEIESGEEVQIFDGDEIIMADETFEFHEE